MVLKLCRAGESNPVPSAYPIIISSMKLLTCFDCGNSFYRKYQKPSEDGSAYCSRSCAARSNNKKTPKRSPEGACLYCAKPISKSRKFCDSECRFSDRTSASPKSKREPKQDPIERNRRNVKSHARRLKLKAVAELGGKCMRCSYSNCIQALQFHHRDPSTKCFNISGGSRSWSRIKEELKKCDLLCANCHVEVEYMGRPGLEPGSPT